MTQVRTNVTVEKKDIFEIGHTIFNEDGCTAIVVGGGTAGLAGILLKSVLKCFGDEYAITEAMEHDGDVLIMTNLPYSAAAEAVDGLPQL